MFKIMEIPKKAFALSLLLLPFLLTFVGAFLANSGDFALMCFLILPPIVGGVSTILLISDLDLSALPKFLVGLLVWPCLTVISYGIAFFGCSACITK